MRRIESLKKLLDSVSYFFFFLEVLYLQAEYCSTAFSFPLYFPLVLMSG